MSDQERFLLTVDSARGVPVKVERIGEAGELIEVDLPGFLSSLTPGSAAAPVPQQIVINIYGGAAGATPVVERVEGPKPVTQVRWGPQDHPGHGGGRPPHKPGGGEGDLT
jgi:hypothetical protein